MLKKSKFKSNGKGKCQKKERKKYLHISCIVTASRASTIFSFETFLFARRRLQPVIILGPSPDHLKRI